jgi:hypothetical protein
MSQRHFSGEELDTGNGKVSSEAYQGCRAAHALSGFKTSDRDRSCQSGFSTYDSCKEVGFRANIPHARQNAPD